MSNADQTYRTRTSNWGKRFCRRTPLIGAFGVVIGLCFPQVGDRGLAILERLGRGSPTVALPVEDPDSQVLRSFVDGVSVASFDELYSRRLSFLAVALLHEVGSDTVQGLQRLVPHALEQIREGDRVPAEQLLDVLDQLDASNVMAAEVRALRAELRAADPGGASVQAQRTKGSFSDLERRWMDAARLMSDGPIEDIVRSNGMFIWVVEQLGGDDPALWHGMDRLCDWCLKTSDKNGLTIAKRILAAFRNSPPPGSMNQRRIDLEQLLWKAGGR